MLIKHKKRFAKLSNFATTIKPYQRYIYFSSFDNLESGHLERIQDNDRVSSLQQHYRDNKLTLTKQYFYTHLSRGV